jgi:hypothetical protein
MVALVIPWCRRQRDRLAKFIRSADDVVTVLGLHSGDAHEARFLSIGDAGKFRFPCRQDMAMARAITIGRVAPISVPVAQLEFRSGVI